MCFFNQDPDEEAKRERKEKIRRIKRERKMRRDQQSNVLLNETE